MAAQSRPPPPAPNAPADVPANPNQSDIASGGFFVAFWFTS